jgi:hypothetical protein
MNENFEFGKMMKDILRPSDLRSLYKYLLFKMSKFEVEEYMHLFREFFTSKEPFKKLRARGVNIAVAGRNLIDIVNHIRQPDLPRDGTLNIELILEVTNLRAWVSDQQVDRASMEKHILLHLGPHISENMRYGIILRHGENIVWDGTKNYTGIPINMHLRIGVYDPSILGKSPSFLGMLSTLPPHPCWWELISHNDSRIERGIMIYNDIKSHWFSKLLLIGSVKDVMEAQVQIMELTFARRNPPVHVRSIQVEDVKTILNRYNLRLEPVVEH